MPACVPHRGCEVSDHVNAGQFGQQRWLVELKGVAQLRAMPDSLAVCANGLHFVGQHLLVDTAAERSGRTPRPGLVKARAASCNSLLPGVLRLSKASRRVWREGAWAWPSVSQVSTPRRTRTPSTPVWRGADIKPMNKFDGLLKAWARSGASQRCSPAVFKARVKGADQLAELGQGDGDNLQALGGACNHHGVNLLARNLELKVQMGARGPSRWRPRRRSTGPVLRVGALRVRQCGSSGRTG